ncbi:MAG: hypothetical protein HQ517_00955 [SAR324 cluster bacterium]|nr:hypothetical protein [SAR324 cluster bacterium]
MSYWNYAPYVSVAQRKAKAEKKIKQLKKKNPNISPIVISGRALATSWWGKSWNRNLERYADYHNRIERGRNYVRHGSVLDLQIRPGRIEALVQGSRSTPYRVIIQIETISQRNWTKIKSACEGKLDSLQELLAGKFPTELQDIFMAQGKGLFPTPEGILLSCNCPDSAYMCKHIAATLYGVGTRLDESPNLFFELRKVGIDDLIGQALEEEATQMLDSARQKSSRVIEDDDLGDLFGIVMEEAPVFKKKKKNISMQKLRDEIKSPTQMVIPKSSQTPQNENTKRDKPQKNGFTELEAANFKLKNALQEMENAAITLKKLQAGMQRDSPKPIALVAGIIINSPNRIGIKELAQKTDLEKSTLYSLIQRLKSQGKIRNKAYGIYVGTGKRSVSDDKLDAIVY